MVLWEGKKKVTKLLTGLLGKKERRHKWPVSETREAIITVDLTNIKKVTRNYDEKLYGSEFNNADEIDEFFERFEVPKLTQKEISWIAINIF